MPNMRFRGRENTMHSILKRSAALIASAATLLGGGMLMAGTAQADGIGLPVMTIHPAASTSYPKELVNGDFQTFGNRIVDKRSGGWQYLSFVDGNGMAMEGSSERPWAKVDGWDAVKFGWKSNDSVSGHRGIVEVQRFRTAVKGSTGNVWGEIAAATQGKYLYQDIDTANTSDAMYTIRLKHASRNKDARDSMQVLVGAPGREKPVTMRRTIANAGDKAGEESTTITSTGTGQDDQWDTYEGTVLVPRGQDVTRFTFKSVADSNSAGRPDSAEGNLIDDVVFTKAYQLTYDANGGVKTRTSQIDYTTGGETRGKVKTVRDSPAPPAGQEKIVNGDFEYSGTGAGLSDSPFNYVSLSQKSYYYKDSRNVNHRVALPAGFDAKRFAWKSDQTGKDLGNPPYEQAGDVQVWNRYDGSNHYAELTAAQAGSAIYQDIDTESDSDVQYIVSLRHASLNASHLDSMQVLIGAPGHETPVTMTRVTANGYGDKVGESSDTIATRVSNPKPADREDSDHTGQWETYTGTVTVPAGRPVTRFTFRNVSSKSAWNGNLIDDIAFTKARRLDYDANGGTKAQASQIGYRTDATQGAVETVASKTLPTELVNGSFDYLLDGGWDTISPVGRGGYADDRGWGRFTSVDPASGEYIQNAGQNPATFDSTGKWVKWPGFDAAKFGWASDQKGGQPQGGVGLTDRPNAVELQQDSVTGNTYAEIVGSERGKAILQKIDTQHDSDTVYTVRFDHASLSKEHADSMQVLVNGKPVTMTRVTSNKAGDEQGWTGTSITTHATNTNRFQHDGQWATYEGKVTIPANTPVSTFTFKALNAVDPTKGNLIDNLTFKIAYRLSYDSNGGTKAKASQISSMTEGKASETDGKVKTVADNTSNLPDHLVNGTFDYRGNEIINENQRVYGDTTYLAMISAKTGVIGNPLHSKLDNWDSGKFGWKSNDDTAGADTVEVQRRNHTPYPTNAGNVWGEIAAAKRGKYIYQDIATTPGVVYKWSLKHASRNAGQDDSMQVMIGEPGKTVAQQTTRTTSNGSDKTGSVGTTITTHGTAQDGRWETYTGDYLATSTTTRFTFRSIRDSNGQGLDFTAEGNCVDDLSFDKAYRLSYDKNSSDATGSVPSNQYGKENTVQPAKSKTTGSVGLAADKTASGLTVHDLKKNDKGKVPSSSKADSTQPAAFKAPDAKVETIASRAAGDELAVNGGFDTPKWTIAKEGQGLPWVYVTPNAGMIRSYAQAMAGQTGVKAGGLTAATFAWQDVDATGGNQNFELHREKDGNTAADVHAGRTVAQTVATTPGAAYTFSIRHSGRSKGNAGGVTLLTGPDKDHLTPVKLTRTTVSKTGQKYGDKTGDVGTVAYTHSDSMDATEGSHEPWDHSDDWESYEGTVIIPAGQSRTMIAYRGVAKDGTLTASANDSIIDDLSFRLAYKLSYDANGGTGQVPSRTEAGKTETAASRMNGTVRLAADRDTEPESGTTTDDRKVLTDTIARQDDGTSQRTITRSDGSVQVQTIADTGAVSGCQVYYPAGAKITLATAKADSDCWDSSQISKTNRTFYGWSANTDANDKDVPVADTMDRATLDANAETQITMPARAKTVYALWAINPTLTYNVNAPATTKAPDAPASMTVPYNTAADDKSGWTVGDTGKITGYSFDGWYTSPTGGDKYDWSTKLTNDVTMYAHWTANGYTVKYDAGGGKGTMGDQKFTFDVPQNLSPNAFTRDGYTFTGWKRADTGDSYTDGQQVSNLTSTPNGIVTMIAQWTPNPASINYDPNPPTGRTPGGQGTANWTGHTGDTQAIGANGWTVDGYTFIGWNTSADGKGTAYAPGTTWTANGTLTLYAQWTPGQAGLTYDGNGATGGKTDPQPGKTDEKINVRDNGFTRDGYMFVTWNTQADCKGKAVDPGDEWTLQGSGTLYACWAGTAQTLAYHGNGATGGNTAVQSGKTGDELTTNANGFTRDGYTFVRWDTAKDGSGTAYGEGKNGVSQYTMKPAGNDLYAIWKANPASIVYRNGYPNTTGSTPDTTGSTGDTVTVSQNGFDRPGYTFTGWSTSKRGDPSLNPGDKHTLEPGTTTVWAQWKANPAHLVYNSNIGSIGSETKTVDGVVDQTVKTIDNPFDRPGYTFSGWNTQADGKGKAYDPGADCTLTANDKSTPKNTSVLYAQWTINKVTLKFDPNGGVGGYPSINTDAFGSVTIPKDAKEPKVTRPGFRFTGWSLKKTPDKDETLLTPGKDTVSMPAEGEVTVYAQWEPAMTTLPFAGGNAQIPTIWLWAGLAFLIIAAGAFSPMIRLRMGAGSKGRHAGTPTIGRHSR